MPQKPNRRRSSGNLRRRGSGSSGSGGKPLRNAGDSPKVLELKTTYEGPCGPKTEKWLHKSTLIVTNRTIEIEREGANCLLSTITLGCWWALFQTATIEIYELDCIIGLQLKGDWILCQMDRQKGNCKSPNFVIDVPPGGDYSTADLYYELKEAWHVARHGVLDDDDCALSDEHDSEEEPV